MMAAWDASCACSTLPSASEAIKMQLIASKAVHTLLCCSPPSAVRGSIKTPARVILARLHHCMHHRGRHDMQALALHMAPMAQHCHLEHAAHSHMTVAISYGDGGTDPRGLLGRCCGWQQASVRLLACPRAPCHQLGAGWLQAWGACGLRLLPSWPSLACGSGKALPRSPCCYCAPVN